MQLWKECLTYITTNQFFNLLNSNRNCNKKNNNNNMLLISKQIINIYNDCSSSLSSWFIKAILTAIYSYPLHVPYKAALKRTLATQFGFFSFRFLLFGQARATCNSTIRRSGEMAAMNFGSVIAFTILSCRTISEWFRSKREAIIVNQNLFFGLGPQMFQLISVWVVFWYYYIKVIEIL